MIESYPKRWYFIVTVIRFLLRTEILLLFRGKSLIKLSVIIFLESLLAFLTRLLILFSLILFLKLIIKWHSLSIGKFISTSIWGFTTVTTTFFELFFIIFWWLSHSGKLLSWGSLIKGWTKQPRVFSCVVRISLILRSDLIVRNVYVHKWVSWCLAQNKLLYWRWLPNTGLLLWKICLHILNASFTK